MKKIFISFIFLSFLVAGISAQHPTIGGYNVYYGDLHNHSNVSDGTGTPASAYSYARDTAHLDFFSLADHSNAISPTEWADVKDQADHYNQDGIFTAFYGFEWSSNGMYGHVAVINTSDYCTINAPTDTFESLVNWLASYTSGIAFFNHPGREDDNGLEFKHFSTTPSDRFAGVELWNNKDSFARYFYNDGYYPGDNKSYYDEALARGWRVGAMGSGDNHKATWGTAFPYRMAILADNLTRSDLLEAMQSRRFYSTLDKNLLLSFKINGLEMGSSLIGSNHTAQIQAADGDNEIFTEAVLYDRDHNIVNTWTLYADNINETIDLDTHDGDYFYVRVKQADDDEAISSPIRISGSTANRFPVCYITSPLSYATATALTTVTIDADAADPDGIITKVEFYQGRTKLGEDMTGPYTFNWNGVSVGSYLLTIKAFDDLGAITTSVAVPVEVTPRPVTVTADIKTKIYGDTDPALTFRITSGSLAGTDSFSGTLIRDAGENVGTYSIRQGSLALNENYAITYVSSNLSITPRPITVAAYAKKKVYGDTDPVLNYSVISGMLTGTDTFTGGLSRDPGEEIGTYAIKQGNLTPGNNYDLTFKEATFRITRKFEMLVYPNPFSEVIYFELDLKKNARISIDIYDLTGKKLATVFSGDLEDDYYRFEYKPGHKLRGICIYRLTVGGEEADRGKIVGVE